MADLLRFRKVLAAAPQFFLRALLLRHVDDEGHTALALRVESGHADQHRHQAAVLVEILLFIRGQAAGLLELLQVSFLLAVEPFAGCQVGPSQATRDEIRALVADDAKKRVIGLENLTTLVPEDDPDDVGVDQSADLRFPFPDFAVQVAVFKRNRRLGSDQLQDADPVGREDACRKPVFQVQQRDQCALLHQRQAEYRADALRADVRVGGMRVPG